MEGYIDEDLVPRIVNLKIIGLKENIPIEPILDTGFNGEFSLPIKFLSQSKVQFIGTDYFELGDGTVVEKEIFAGEVIVGEGLYQVEMNLTNSNDALIGTGMLKGKIATFDFKEDKIKVES